MKIVLLTSRFPFPLEKGDKLRVYNHIKHLSENNEVTLITVNIGKVSKDNLDQLKSFCKNIHILKL